MKELKWITISIYVDEYTGEVLTKKVLELKQYYIAKKIKIFMKQTNTELLNTQTSADQQDSKQSSQLLEREKIEGNPFELVTTEEGTFIALGLYRLSDFMGKEEAKEKIINKHWDLIISLNLALADAQKKFMQDLANQNNQI